MALIDENAFGALISYYAIEDDEYGLPSPEFAARFTGFRDAVRACAEAFPLAPQARALELGHAVYFEFADGDQREDPLGWLKMVRARLTALGIETVAALTHGGRWLDDDPSSGQARAESKVLAQSVSLPSEPLRRALYADTASRPDTEVENDPTGWGPGLYVDSEAIEALGRSLKNAPTALRIAGATFFRASR
jgi:hypothetical protein